MPSDLLVIGLDGANATLIERWADRGYLPNIAALRKRAARARFTAGCMETLPGAIWPDISLGKPASQHGCLYHFRQYQSREGHSRALREDELQGSETFWATASRAGLRCVVADVPFMPFVRPFNGVQFRDFAVHDLFYGAGSEPPNFLDEMIARYGQPPVALNFCDDDVNQHGRDILPSGLVARGKTKTAILRDLLGQQSWNLFFAVYGESHCAGHYLWPQRDPTTGKLISPVAEFSDPWEALRRVYMGMDDGIGKLIAEAGSAARILVFTSHSMGTYLGGPQLLPEVLRRLGLSDGWEWPGRRILRDIAYNIRHKIPVRAIEKIPALDNGFAGRLRTLFGASPRPENSAHCKAFSIMNNRIGGIRLRVAGRDPGGAVAPEDVDALRRFIIGALHDLVEPIQGRPVVKSVQSTLFDKDSSPNLPDLIVKFHTNLGPLTSCRSRQLGTINVPFVKPGYTRSGDHVPQSHAWLVAPGYRMDEVMDADSLDIAPTILDLLGLAPAPHMTGTALARNAGILKARGHCANEQDATQTERAG